MTQSLAELAALAATNGKTLIIIRAVVERASAILEQVQSPKGTVCLVSTKDIASGTLAARAAGIIGLISLDEPDITDRRALERLAAWAATPA